MLNSMSIAILYVGNEDIGCLRYKVTENSEFILKVWCKFLQVDQTQCQQIYLVQMSWSGGCSA